MNPLSAESVEALRLARNWANHGELQASFIVLEALRKKHPTHPKIFFAFLELLEELDLMKCYSLLGDLLSGDAKWQEVLYNLKNTDRAYLFEKHGLLALKLKDESTALESLNRAASLSQDTLLLWATLSYLLTLTKDTKFAVKSLCRALDLYKEPTLFEENFSFLKKNHSQKSINEELFLSICLALFPQLPSKEATRLLSYVQNALPGRAWIVELQEIVSQEEEKQPIELSGENYASPDKKNW